MKETGTSERVCRIRRELDLSQERLGQLLGVSWTTISRWERGEAAPRGLSAILIQGLDKILASGRGRTLRVELAGVSGPPDSVQRILALSFGAPAHTAATGR